MKAFTDYPIIELGDEAGEVAPVRECTITGYDGDKYATIFIEGVQCQIKAGYLYEEHGRIGTTQQISIKKLEDIMTEQTQTYKQEFTITADIPEGYKAIGYRKPKVGDLYLNSFGEVHTAQKDLSMSRFLILEELLPKTVTLPELELSIEDAQLLFHLTNLSERAQEGSLRLVGVKGVSKASGLELYRKVGAPISTALEEACGIDTVCGYGSNGIISWEELTNEG